MESDNEIMNYAVCVKKKNVAARPTLGKKLEAGEQFKNHW